jgi:hypothetical protein
MRLLFLPGGRDRAIAAGNDALEISCHELVARPLQIRAVADSRDW